MFLSLQSCFLTPWLWAEGPRDVKGTCGTTELYLSLLSSSRVISMKVCSFLWTAAATSFTLELLCLPVSMLKTNMSAINAGTISTRLSTHHPLALAPLLTPHRTWGSNAGEAPRSSEAERALMKVTQESVHQRVHASLCLRENDNDHTAAPPPAWQIRKYLWSPRCSSATQLHSHTLHTEQVPSTYRSQLGTLP